MQGSKSTIFSSNASKKVNFSNETPMTERKLVVMETHELKFRDETLLIALF